MTKQTLPHHKSATGRAKDPSTIRTDFDDDDEGSSSSLSGEGGGGGCDVLHELRRYEQSIAIKPDEIIPALAMRCYHLPRNSYCEDWMQYFQNNHPLLGLFCHHKHHPIRLRLRLLHLTGSVVFGLAVTNIIWLFFYYNGTDQGEPVMTIQLRGFSDNNNDENNGASTAAAANGTFASDASPASDDDNNNYAANNKIAITQGMVLLWTVGALLHAIFDNTVWYMTACVCCLSSRKVSAYRQWGTYTIVVSVLVIAVVATLAMLIRTTVEEMQQQSGYNNYNADEPRVSSITNRPSSLSLHEASVVQLLICYAIEFAIATLLYYPVIATILFSGILGCGNMPVLGGRPYEIKLLEKTQQKRLEEQRRRRQAAATLQQASSSTGADLSRLKGMIIDLERPKIHHATASNHRLP